MHEHQLTANSNIHLFPFSHHETMPKRNNEWSNLKLPCTQ